MIARVLVYIYINTYIHIYLCIVWIIFWALQGFHQVRKSKCYFPHLRKEAQNVLLSFSRPVMYWVVSSEFKPRPYGPSDGKESACNEGDLGSIPGLGRSPGEDNGNPLQYFCLEDSMDRGTWWAKVHEVTELDRTERLTLSLSYGRVLSPRFCKHKDLK